MSNLFVPRTEYKPFEYPEASAFKSAIRQAYWVHDEFQSYFLGDVQDYKTKLSVRERSVVDRSLIAISQVEVAVKQFWAKIMDYIPKPEIGAVGVTFAESEVRHADAYSHLLDLLGMNSLFEYEIKNSSVFHQRIQYLSDFTNGHKQLAPYTQEFYDKFIESVLLFSLFIEHISLFSQFYVLMSFNRHKNLLRGISNAVEATSKEEQIHGDFGHWLIRQMIIEEPWWWTTEKKNEILTKCNIAFDAEKKIIDWIFENGDLEFLSQNDVIDFLKYRFSQSLEKLDLHSELFTVESTEKFQWFNEELTSSAHTDFFSKRPVSYAKNNKSFDPGALF